MSRRTAVSGGFCRKRCGEGWSRFLLLGLLLPFSSVFGVALDSRNEIMAGVEDEGWRNSFRETSSLVGDNSGSLHEKPYDYLRGKLGTPSTTNHDEGEMTKVSHQTIELDFATAQVERNLSNGTVDNTVDASIAVVSKTVFGVTLCLGTMATLLSILSWIFIYLNRNNSLVAIGQPPFLYIICFGSLLLSSELFLLFRYGSTDESLRDATCVTELWCRNIGNVCVRMAIFCKLWRAYKVAKFRKNQIVMPRHVIGPFIIMMVAVIIVTICQTILDPPGWREKEIPSLNNTTIGMCLPSGLELSKEPQLAPMEMSEAISGSRFLWIEITYAILTFLSLAVVLAMAYVTRKLPQEISDSRRVFQAVFSNLLLTAVMYALFWVGVGINSYGLSAFSRSLIFFFDATIFVGFLVVPKIYRVWLQKREKSQSSSEETKGRLPNASMATTMTDMGKGRVFVGGLHPSSRP